MQEAAQITAGMADELYVFVEATDSGCGLGPAAVLGILCGHRGALK
jgi:hypothetical protein